MDDNGTSKTSENRYLLWGEALNWVAYRNFAGWSYGARSADTLQDEDNLEEEDAKAEGRWDLAVEIVVEKAALGKLKVFSIGTLNADLEENCEGPYKVPPEFIKAAAYLEHDGYGFAHEDDGYVGLIVDFDDLCREFWQEGKSPEFWKKVDTATSGLSNYDSGAQTFAGLEERVTRPTSARRSNLGPRRGRSGRPREYDWPGFAVEMTRRLRANELPDRKGECEGQMLLWCSENWPKEPAASIIRAWIAAFYNEFMADRAADRPPGINREIGT
jgi:hypothetical protein